LAFVRFALRGKGYTFAAGGLKHGGGRHARRLEAERFAGFREFYVPGYREKRAVKTVDSVNRYLSRVTKKIRAYNSAGYNFDARRMFY
jgi:hypothetical protein